MRNPQPPVLRTSGLGIPSKWKPCARACGARVRANSASSICVICREDARRKGRVRAELVAG
jgi:hypothetical protein